MSAAKPHPRVFLADVIAKRTGSVDPSKFPDETFELLSIPAFDAGKPEILKGSEIGSSKQIVQEGDVLLSKIVPHIRRSWVVRPKTDHRLIASGEWIVFRNDNFDPAYLRHLLVSDDFHTEFMRTVSGVGGSLLRARPAEVEKISIPQPSPEEQKRIAAILDKADSLRRKRQQAIRLADDFLRAVFLDMFGDPVTNSRKWPVKEIYEIAKVTTGNTPSREMPENFGSAIEWIKSDNINTPSHWLTKATEGLSEQGLSLGRTAPAGSTLMTCIAGSPSCIGNVAMSDRQVAFNQQINALTPFEGTEPEFLYGLLLYSKQRVQDASTNSMKGMVSKGALERVRLIWPPAVLQSAYAMAFRKITALREKQLESDSSSLFSSLQDSLLS